MEYIVNDWAICENRALITGAQEASLLKTSPVERHHHYRGVGTQHRASPSPAPWDRAFSQECSRSSYFSLVFIFCSGRLCGKTLVKTTQSTQRRICINLFSATVASAAVSAQQ